MQIYQSIEFYCLILNYLLFRKWNTCLISWTQTVTVESASLSFYKGSSSMDLTLVLQAGGEVTVVLIAGPTLPAQPPGRNSAYRYVIVLYLIQGRSIKEMTETWWKL